MLLNFSALGSIKAFCAFSYSVLMRHNASDSVVGSDGKNNTSDSTMYPVRGWGLVWALG